MSDHCLKPPAIAEVKNKVDLQPQPSPLVEVIPSETNEKRTSDVPDGERGGNQGDETLALAFTEIAGTQRQLRPGREERHPEHRGRQPDCIRSTSFLVPRLPSDVSRFTLHLLGYGGFQLLQVVAIAVGGALGAVLRYWTSLGVHSWLGRDFPYGTLTVNVAGSLLIGLLSVLLLDRFNVAPEWRAGTLIGVLGAFTTFSTFSIETFNLLEQGDTAKGVLNAVLNFELCLFATWLGLLIGRQL